MFQASPDWWLELNWIPLQIGTMKQLLRPRFGALLTAALMAVGMSVIASGSAQAQPADLHYQCLHVSELVGLPNHLILGLTCTGPIATEWGTVTDTSRGVTYWCNPLSSSLLGTTQAVHGQNCVLF
jgi:hypothetical protein